MLRSRTFLAFLRQHPLRSGVAQASPLRVINERRLLLRHGRLQQHALISTINSPIAHTSTLSRWPRGIIQRMRNVRANSNKSSSPAVQQQSSETSKTLSERFKELSRRYGWAAVGVYFGLSALDFPFCFLAVRLVGPERIGEVEHAIVDGFWNLVAIGIPSMAPEEHGTDEARIQAEARETHPVDVNGGKQKENASIWTQLLLAYGVHKSLIFFRIPLTAAVTPKVVKTLRKWGWNIGRPDKKVKS